MNCSLSNYIIKKIITTSKIYIRSPLICKLNAGICQLCYGWNLANGRMVELGESVGILAAQSIGEPGTQLTMRTFHTGGVFSGEVAKTIIAPFNGTINYEKMRGGKKIHTKYKEKAYLTLEKKLLFLIENEKNKIVIKLPENSIIYSKPGEKVFEKQILAEIIEDPTYIKKEQDKVTKEIKEIKAKLSGQVYIKNKKGNGKSNNLWILSGNLLNYLSIFKNINLEKKTKTRKINTYDLTINNRIKSWNIRDKNANKYLKKLKLSQKIFNNVIKIKPQINKKVNTDYRIKSIFEQKKQVITNKLKHEKYAELKNEVKKGITVGEFYQKYKSINNNTNNKYPMQIIQKRRNIIQVKKSAPYLITKNSQTYKKNMLPIKKDSILFYTYFKKQKTEDIVQGLPKVEELLEAKKTYNLEKIKNSPHDKLNKTFSLYKLKYNNQIACRKSIEKIQKILIDKIQLVYQQQGVLISDKHIEIIVKQMTSKVLIKSPGSSSLITGEIIDLNKVERINKNTENKINYEPILMGISKLSLSNESFISEASFQETTKILTKSAIEGKVDWLFGLKENLIMGNVIPAGTGYKQNK